MIAVVFGGGLPGRWGCAEAGCVAPHRCCWPLENLPPDELATRTPNPDTVAGFAAPQRGWEQLYVQHVMQADTGADPDFLVGSSGDEVSRESH